jgi:ketopantoate reductase
MHVAIVGAGALGRVYGVRLARGGVGVSFVVRAGRMGDGAIAIARVDGGEETDRVDAPDRRIAVPGDADVVLVCVRGDQLDEALIALLAAAPEVPLVMLTPMMPQDYERLRARLGARVIAAMPSVVAYGTEDGTTRYWLPRTATTLIDEPRPMDAALEDLVRSLETAGIGTRFALGVHESNPATTVAFIPLAMGLDVAGSIDALLEDEALLDLALRASDEGMELAGKIGTIATWAGVALKLLGSLTLRIAVAIGRRRSPEGFAYVEEHFGRKIHVQNVRMAESIVELARAKGTPHVALAALLERLRARDHLG